MQPLTNVGLQEFGQPKGNRRRNHTKTEKRRTGKGNPEWLESAPHGAGRILSRNKAKSTLSMDEFRKSMEDVYSTSVCESTLDEAPMAYKPIGEIVECIQPTVTIQSVIKPLYNFKAK